MVFPYWAASEMHLRMHIIAVMSCRRYATDGSRHLGYHLYVRSSTAALYCSNIARPVRLTGLWIEKEDS